MVYLANRPINILINLSKNHSIQFKYQSPASSLFTMTFNRHKILLKILRDRSENFQWITHTRVFRPITKSIHRLFYFLRCTVIYVPHLKFICMLMDDAKAKIHPLSIIIIYSSSLLIILQRGSSLSFQFNCCFICIAACRYRSWWHLAITPGQVKAIRSTYDLLQRGPTLSPPPLIRRANVSRIIIERGMKDAETKNTHTHKVITFRIRRFFHPDGETLDISWHGMSHSVLLAKLY